MQATDERQINNRSKAARLQRVPVEDWGWQDFMFYFITSHNAVMPKNHPHVGTRQWQELKGKIEFSMRERGNVLLKEMIDWVFENYQRYPQWEKVSIDLVCGRHGWADEIADEADSRLGSKLVFDPDEEL
jgi:hypothetical protein